MHDRELHRGSPRPYPRPIDDDPGLTPAGCLLAIMLAAALWFAGAAIVWWIWHLLS